jgi:hypothetical protein
VLSDAPAKGRRSGTASVLDKRIPPVLVFARFAYVHGGAPFLPANLSPIFTLVTVTPIPVTAVLPQVVVSYPEILSGMDLSGCHKGVTSASSHAAVGGAGPGAAMRCATHENQQ